LIEWINDKGGFKLKNPDMTSYLYFPLANEAGMMSSITPNLAGDSKIGQNSFIMPPASSEDLHNSCWSRNFWLLINNKLAWSASGNSALQKADKYNENKAESSVLEAGFLWHRVTRINTELGIEAKITNFVPQSDDTVELMNVIIKNISDKNLTLTATAAIPIYGRSADNIRDHRHVTSLLNKITTNEYGIEVKPTMSFDESGHKLNNISYGVYGADWYGNKPIGFYPTVEYFTGEGGSFDWPCAVVKNYKPLTNVSIDGYEAMGGLKFKEIVLGTGEQIEYTVCIACGTDLKDIPSKYIFKFKEHFENNECFWNELLSRITFTDGNQEFNNWMKWVSLQPILRRIYGCSFLPHHDYGRGGRGWRDLWQDCLSLLLTEPESTREIIISNFAGVRMDGSNATIIGKELGEFIADRNNIPRVWMDHGAWPLPTTKLYINQTGDLDMLLHEQTYFKDKLMRRSKSIDNIPQEDNVQLDKYGRIYKGTIFEHLLLQNLTPFYNVGKNGSILLEGADWNDAFDMAVENGESVAFTSFYSNNLAELSQLSDSLMKEKGINEVDLASEVNVLLYGEFDNFEQKRNTLKKFYEGFGHTVSGEKVKIKLSFLSEKLKKMSIQLKRQIRDNEWITDKNGYEWFNGYYDNSGSRVEGDNPNGTRMTLTGQVFAISSGTATEEQTKKIIASAKKYLYDEKVGGYRLNTDFKELYPQMGRCFGFAYGHKENGAMFSHMAVMFANSLYKRHFKKEGFEIINGIYKHISDFNKSKIYPGIPEYINEHGRGMYHYLTGSASWTLLTVVTSMYGVYGELGNLVIEPQLMPQQFNKEGRASISINFAGKRIDISFINEEFKEDYKIQSIRINGKILYSSKSKTVIIDRKHLVEVKESNNIELSVYLY